MSPNIEHDHFYDEPVRLSENEIDRPISVLLDFFSKISLREIRLFFDDVSETCLVTDIGPFRLGEQRSKLISTRRDIERVMEACMVLVKSDILDHYADNE